MRKEDDVRFEAILEKAREEEIGREDAVFLFENSKDPVRCARLFEAASFVRKREVGDLFRLDGWMGGNTECKVNPPCLYCRRAVPGCEFERWGIPVDRLDEVAEAFKRTGTTTVEIGGGTDPENAGPTVIEMLEALRKHGLDVWVNVGPALERHHVEQMKALGVNAIASSFETMNEEIFRRLKPGDDLEKRKKLAHLVNDVGVALVSVMMVGIGESSEDRVEHMFYLKELENFRWLCVTWLRVHPGGPLDGAVVPPSPIEAARTAAVARLVFRDIDIGMAGPQHIQLSVLAGANRLVHAGASLHRKGGYRIGGEGFGTEVQRFDVVDGYEMHNLLPVTARWVMDAGMEVEPSIRCAIGMG